MTAGELHARARDRHRSERKEQRTERLVAWPQTKGSACGPQSPVTVTVEPVLQLTMIQRTREATREISCSLPMITYHISHLPSPMGHGPVPGARCPLPVVVAMSGGRVRAKVRVLVTVLEWMASPIAYHCRWQQSLAPEADKHDTAPATHPPHLALVPVATHLLRRASLPSFRTIF